MILQIGTLLSTDDAQFGDVILKTEGLKTSAFARVPTDGTVALNDYDTWNANGGTLDLKWSLYLKSTCTSDKEDNAGTLWVEQFDSENCGAEVAGVVPIGD